MGRGCLAGPLLVVAAKAFSDLPQAVADSKSLSRSQREQIFEELVKFCRFGEGWVSCNEIDTRGLAAAMRLGVSRALRALAVDKNEQIVVDGSVNYAPKTYRAVELLVGADGRIPIVSAASIYAKVKRDRYMTRLKSRYPQYGFESHVGYGTPAHKEALRSYGILKNIHRVSFRPLRLIDQGPQA